MPPAPRILACLAAVVLFPSAAAAVDLPRLLPETGPIEIQAPRGSIETYDPDTLWEKIDGEAELYRRFGVVGAAFAHYEHPEDFDRSLELSVFAFADSLSAFGIYASFRSPDDPREDLGNEAVVGSYQGYLWHGTYFAVADAFGPPDVRAAAIRQGLSAIAAAIGTVPPAPALLESFREVTEPASVGYRPDHLLGREIFPPGLEGSLADGTRIFISTESTDAESVLASYRALLEHPVRTRHGEALLLFGRDPFLGPVTVAAGRSRLAGARALPGDEGLTDILLGLLRQGL